MIAGVKALHIIALVIWCAALIALPLLLMLHRRIFQGGSVVSNYIRFRILTHVTYTLVATPAAVIAIAAGTVLIFLAGIFEPWLLAKLAAVTGMVLAHAWCGHLVLQSGERDLSWKMPPPGLALVVALPSMAAVLFFVLAKPDLSELPAHLPEWMTQPVMLELPDWVQEALP